MFCSKVPHDEKEKELCETVPVKKCEPVTREVKKEVPVEKCQPVERKECREIPVPKRIPK